MRLLSLNKRLALDAPASDLIEVALIEISHADLPAPIRLSTDNTERITTDPLVYGTRSTWRGANPASEPFLWVVAGAVLPGDDAEAPATAQLILDNLDSAMVELLRAVSSPPDVALAVVMAASPDLVEQEWTGLRVTSAEVDAGQIVLSLSRDQIELEPFPAGRMTRRNFPGLHS